MDMIMFKACGYEASDILVKIFLMNFDGNILIDMCVRLDEI